MCFIVHLRMYIQSVFCFVKIDSYWVSERKVRRKSNVRYGIEEYVNIFWDVETPQDSLLSTWYIRN